MMNRSAMSLLIAATFAALLFAAGCSDDGPMEEAGETVDEAVEDAGDKVEDATE